MPEATKMNEELLKEIERLYYDEKLSITKVAAGLNIAVSTVSLYLNKYSHGTRSLSEAGRLRSTDEYRKKIGISKQGEKASHAKLTNQEVKKIRHEYDGLILDQYEKIEAQKKLAWKYGVTRATISDVVLRRTWKHILAPLK